MISEFLEPDGEMCQVCIAFPCLQMVFNRGGNVFCLTFFLSSTEKGFHLFDEPGKNCAGEQAMVATSI